LSPKENEDSRLPQPGRVVLVDVARVARGNVPGRTFRLVAREGLTIRLEGDTRGPGVPPGMPLVVTVDNGRQLFGTVVGNPHGGIVDVQLEAPPQLRRSERRRLSVDVEVELLDEPASAPTRGTAVDISPGAMRLSIEKRLAVGAHAFVVIRLPGQEPAVAVAEVLECVMQPNEYSYTARLRFACISDDHVRRIGAFADQLPHEPAA
jgi:hypothetical protein